MGTAPDAVKRLVDRFDQNRDATDGSQLTAFSPRLDSDSGPSAASRKPIADVLGEVYEQFLGKAIRLAPSNRAKVEKKPKSLVPTRSLDTLSAPHKLSAMQSEPRTALTDSEPVKVPCDPTLICHVPRGFTTAMRC
jgi:hypothetical protein